MKYRVLDRLAFFLLFLLHGYFFLLYVVMALLRVCAFYAFYRLVIMTSVWVATLLPHSILKHADPLQFGIHHSYLFVKSFYNILTKRANTKPLYIIIYRLFIFYFFKRNVYHFLMKFVFTK